MTQNKKDERSFKLRSTDDDCLSPSTTYLFLGTCVIPQALRDEVLKLAWNCRRVPSLRTCLRK